MAIPFNKPLITGEEQAHIMAAMSSNKLCGDGGFTKKCNALIEESTSCARALLTTSCTHGLEMAALLAKLEPGDEVIMPSFTFVSTANPFVLQGAKIVFVDIRPDTMNMDETLIEAAITPKTKVIAPVHYAGVGCEMDTIMAIAKKHNLLVVEDAAQCVEAYYKGKALGSIGQMGAFSFHETKNIQCGEGGALLINDEKYLDRAEIIREKGTNRSLFLRGQVDKYTWVDIGSSYLPSELNAAFLYPQLLGRKKITEKRLAIWDRYWKNLVALRDKGQIELPFIPADCQHNGHMFYIKCADKDERQELINFLKSNGVQSVFHYVPLHSAVAGQKFSRFHGEDCYTTKESERLLRLPMFYDLTMEEVDKVCELVHDFCSTLERQKTRLATPN